MPRDKRIKYAGIHYKALRYNLYESEDEAIEKQSVLANPPPSVRIVNDSDMEGARNLLALRLAKPTEKPETDTGKEAFERDIALATLLSLFPDVDVEIMLNLLNDAKGDVAAVRACLMPSPVGKSKKRASNVCSPDGERNVRPRYKSPGTPPPQSRC